MVLYGLFWHVTFADVLFYISHKRVLDALHESEPLNDPRHAANDRQNNTRLSNTPTTLVKKVTFVNKGS